MSEVRINISVVTRSAIAAVDRFVNRSQRQIDSLLGSIRKQRAGFETLRNASVVTFGAIAAGSGLALKAFIDFEKGLIGVQKTTDLTSQELEQLSDNIIELSKNIPVTTNELLEIAQTAGQLGVRGTQNITLFTDTIAKLGTAANISGDEAATSLTRILNVANEGTENIDELGAAVVQLGNNFAATESEIVSAGKEVAIATAQFGVSSGEAVAFGAAVRSVGIQSELARSTFLQSFGAIRNAIDNGGEAFENLQQITGQTAEQLRKNFEEDASGVFVSFLEGLNRVREEGGNVSQTLEGVNLRGIRLNATLPTLAARTDIVTDALSQAAGQFENATALEEEFARANQSTAAQLGLLRNEANALLITIGDSLAPTFRAIIGFVREVIAGFQSLDPVLKDIIIAVGGAVTVAAALAGAVGTIAVALPALKLAFIALAGPVGIIIGAFAALAAGAVFVARNFDLISGVILGVASDIAFGFAESLAVLAQFEGGVRSTLAFIIRAFAATFGQIPIIVAESLGSLLKLVGVDVPDAVLNARDSVNQLADSLESGSGSTKALSDELRTVQEQLRGASDASFDEAVAQREATQAKNENTDAIQKNIEKKLEEQQVNQELQAQQDERNLFEQARAEEARAAEEAVAAEKRFAADEDFQFLQENLGREEAARIAANARRLREEGKTAEAVASLRQAADQAEQARRQRELTEQQSFFAATNQLAQSENKALAAIGKAGALAQVAINTEEAISNSFKFGTRIGGPPLGFVFGGIAAAAGASQAARIAGLSFQDGGIVPGNSFSGDNVSANVNSGEMILNRNQQANLFALANGGGGGGENVINTTVQLDGEVVARAVSRQVANGLTLGEFD